MSTFATKTQSNAASGYEPSSERMTRTTLAIGMLCGTIGSACRETPVRPEPAPTPVTESVVPEENHSTDPELRTVDELVAYSNAQLELSWEARTGLPETQSLELYRARYASQNAPERALFLNGLEHLDARTADLIREWDGSRLFLPDVRTIQPAAWSAVASFSASKLYLNGLKTLSGIEARKLVTWNPHGDLYLCAVERLDLEAAQALATRGTFRLETELALDGLRKPSAEVVSVLMRGATWELSLNGLAVIDADRARAIAGFDRPKLSLLGVREITAEAVPFLADWRIKFLDLQGLVSLTPELAHALAAAPCHVIDLRGLESMSLETAKALTGVGSNRFLLTGLQSLSPEAAELLSVDSGRFLLGSR